MIRTYEFSKALDQTMTQKHMKLRSLLDRVFVTSNHVAATPATHVNMSTLKKQKSLPMLKAMRCNWTREVHLDVFLRAVVHLRVRFHVFDRKIVILF